MGRILFLSAVAYLAYKYIGRSNKKHQEIAAQLGNTEVLPPAPKESATPAVSPATSLLIEQRSTAVEPHLPR